MERRLPGPDVTPQQLRDRSWWTGPGAVRAGRRLRPGGVRPDQPAAAAAGVPAAGPRHRPAPGVTRRAGGASRALYEPVIQRLRELSSPGLVMSGPERRGRADRRRPARRRCRRAVAGWSPGGRGYGWSSWPICRRTEPSGRIGPHCRCDPHRRTPATTRGFGVISLHRPSVIRMAMPPVSAVNEHRARPADRGATLADAVRPATVPVGAGPARGRVACVAVTAVAGCAAAIAAPRSPALAARRTAPSAAPRRSPARPSPSRWPATRSATSSGTRRR